MKKINPSAFRMKHLSAFIALMFGAQASAQVLEVNYSPGPAEEINFIDDQTLTKKSLVININDAIPSRVAPIAADIDGLLYGQRFLTPWRDTTFRRTPDATLTPPKIFEVVEQVDLGFNFWFKPKGIYAIKLNKLTVEGLHLLSNVVKFEFGNSDSTEQSLRLNNATLELNVSPTFTNIGTTSISVAPGTSNVIRIPFGMNVFGTPTLTVAGTAGMTADQTVLKLDNTGDLNSTATSSWFHLVGNGNGARINIDNGTLWVNDSRLHISTSQEDAVNRLGGLNVINGGVLKLTGAATIVSVPSLFIKDSVFNSATGSRVSVGLDSTLLVKDQIWLSNAQIENYGKISAPQALASFSGTNLITSSNNKKIEVDYLRSEGSNASLTLESVGNFTTGYLDLRQGATLNLTGTTQWPTLFRVGSNGIDITGNSTINVFNNAFFINQISLVGYSRGSSGRINIYSGGKVYFPELSGIHLSNLFELSISGAGFLEVVGTLSGHHAIGGSGGYISFITDQKNQYNGVLSPGSRDAGFRFGTITTDALVAFYSDQDYWGGLVNGSVYSIPSLVDFINSGVFNGGRYLADIGVVNGVAINDQLLYGNGDVRLVQMKNITVAVPDAATKASDLHGKAFTLIAASAPGVAGKLIVPGTKVGSLTTVPAYSNLSVTRPITIVKDASVPALIDFTITDLNTNGKPDLTLLAEMNIDHLGKAAGVDRRNRVAASALLANAYTGGGLVVQSSLDDLKTGQVAAHLDSFHPEPYSSYLTVGQQRSQLLLNTVSNAITPGGFAASNTRVEQKSSTEKRAWADASHVQGQVRGSDGLGGFRYSLDQLTLGRDLLGNKASWAGAFVSFANTRMNEHDLAVQRFSDRAISAGGYFEHDTDTHVKWRAVAGVSYSDIAATRGVALGSVSGSVRANYAQRAVFGQVKASQQVFENDWLSLAPQLGISLIAQSQSRVVEAGTTGLELTVDPTQTTTVYGTAALTARFKGWRVAESATPIAFVRYERGHSLSGEGTAIQAALNSNLGFKQSFVGRDRGADNLSVGLGLTSQPAARWRINGGLLLSIDRHGSEFGLGLQAQYAY